MFFGGFCGRSGQITSYSSTLLINDIMMILKFKCLSQVRDEFVMKEGICMVGFTPEALQDFCSDLLECGIQCRKLITFSRPPVVDSFYQKGLVYQAFVKGVHTYLQLYWAAILSLTPDTSLFKIKFQCRKLIRQIR